MKAFQPRYLVVDENVLSLPITQNVISHFSPIEPQIVPEGETFNEQTLINSLSDEIPDKISAGKEILYLTPSKGHTLKQCPGMGDYVCCNYFVINFVQNCHMECSYCFLQEYLNRHSVIIHPNVEEVLDSVKTLVESRPDRLFRIGTGELADSLAFDHFTKLSHHLVPFFDAHSNAILELKSKTANIGALLEIPASQQVLISWSLTPPQISDIEERLTDSVSERLKAAKKCLDHGYQVAFHLDPIIHFPGYESAYRQLLDEMADTLTFSRISWISKGSLRFNAWEPEKLRYRHPDSQLLTGEFVKSPDGKIRYFREIREELLSTIDRLIDEKDPSMHTYLCMEGSYIWKDVYTDRERPQAFLDKQFQDRVTQTMKLLPSHQA